MNQEKAEPSKKTGPVWAIVANVRDEIPQGEGYKETRRGTNHFHTGAKVFLAGANTNTPANDVVAIVVGHYRGKGYVTVALNAWKLTNWRAELIYSPTVIARLAEPHEAAQTTRNWEADGSPGW